MFCVWTPEKEDTYQRGVLVGKWTHIFLKSLSAISITRGLSCKQCLREKPTLNCLSAVCSCWPEPSFSKEFLESYCNQQDGGFPHPIRAAQLYSHQLLHWPITAAPLWPIKISASWINQTVRIWSPNLHEDRLMRNQEAGTSLYMNHPPDSESTHSITTEDEDS